MADEHPPVTADFAETLRRARRATGLSQEELAERAGLSARAISDLERGVNRAPRRDTLDLLGDALALTPDERRQWERLRRQSATRTRGQPTDRSHDASRRASASNDRGDAGVTSLPSQPTRFFGRHDELHSLTHLLGERDIRLVTLTGPGGSGKTRLAIETAGRLADEYSGGAVFVDLAPVSDAPLVLSTIAATLGIRPRHDQPLITTVTDWIADKRMLLVLDNLEQVLDAASDIGVLLDRCPMLQVLATSRAPLHLRAEREFPVLPLPLPPINGRVASDTIEESHAVRLFIDRAQAVRPDATTDDDLRVVASICHRLDGLPLAIELAAASVRLFTPQAILERIEHRLPLVTSGHRDAPARQRTLRDTIAWSYALLSSDEQRIFRSLSIFRGGWTIEATEAVVRGDDGSEPIDVFHGLVTLTEHSLIQSTPWLDGSPRFSMLETIREFGLVQLEEHGEIDDVHRRHATYFTHMFTGSENDWHSPSVQRWFQHGDANVENLRLALTWATEHHPEMALHLACELAWYWFMRGAHREAMDWLEQALTSDDDIPDVLRARALYWMGALATTFGDFQVADTCISEALALYEHLNDGVGTARSLFALARNAMWSGDIKRSETLYEEAAQRFRVLDDPWLSTTLGNLGGALAAANKLDRATVVLDEALVLTKRYGGVWDRALILETQSLVALQRHDLPRARRTLEQSLILAREVHDPRYIAQSLEVCAWLAITDGAVEHAARVLGAVQRIRETIAVPVSPMGQREYDRYLPLAQALISSDEWKNAWSEGYALTQAEAISLALRGVEKQASGETSGGF